MHPTSASSRCPCCGRRRRARAKIMQSAPLIDWIEQDKAIAAARASAPTGARLLLRHDLRDAAGEPRACLAFPGRLPLAFPTISAALAALAQIEAGRGSC